MTRIQVAPTHGGIGGATLTNNEASRGLDVLSKWASHRVRRRSLRSNTTPGALIEITRSRQLVAREKVFRQHLPFSWPRFMMGLVSLVLVFSDVPRSGIGVSSVQTIFPSLQPDEMLIYGSSWNHSVFSATRAESDSGSVKARVWNYKFDSTSIVWRAFASYLAVPEFPECLFYRVACPDEYFGSDIAFDMIDSLVNAVQNVKYTSNKWPRTHSGPKALTLRTQNEYIDRLHQFLLPTWFAGASWRTSQALHYSSEVLAKINAHSICFPARGGRTHTPQFCQEFLINFSRSCAATDVQGRSVGLLYVHTMNRLRDVQARFPNSTVDLTVLESQEDMQVCRGALTYTGFRNFDVSTIIRAQKCNSENVPGGSASCETEFVDDYRYETELLVSDVVQWYQLVMMLRLVGQSYFFFRAIGLVLSCYFVYDTSQSEDKIFTWTRIRNAFHLFVKVPTQCVVYGSPFPVACYVFAHFLDAPFTYMMLESHFYSQAGIVNLPFRDFISYVIVQMRNVWIYTMAWHLVMSVLSSRWMKRNNFAHNGIVGVPAFFLSTMSSITLLAQYRSTSFRSAKLLEVMPFPSNIGRAWQAVKYHGFTHRGKGSMWLGGVIIDLKFLIYFVLAATAVWALRIVLLRFTSPKLARNSHWFVLAPTPVPYSAGVLWPATSLSVQWRTTLFCFGQYHQYKKSLVAKRLQLSSVGGRVAPFVQNSYQSLTRTQNPQRTGTKHDRTFRDSIRLSTRRYIQHQMMCLHGRSKEVEATIAFMNAVLLSDPLVYLHIIFGNDESTQLGYYQSVWRPQQIVLLPMVVVGENNEYTNGLKLLRRVNASELTWSELVQCG